MLDELEFLPKRTAELVAVIGLEAALILVKEFGGTHLDIPKKAKAQHKLVAFIGFAAFEKLCAYYGGTPLEIDLCANILSQKKQQAIQDGIKRGMTNAQLARQYHTTERTIRRIKQRIQGMRNNPVNLDLFDSLVS